MQSRSVLTTISTMSVRTDQIRLRLREEMTRLRYSVRGLARDMAWGPSRLDKILSGRTELTIEDLEAICAQLRLSLTEVVRDHGLEFCADMTPTELRLLIRLRELTPVEHDAILKVLHIKRPATPERYATPQKKSIFGKPRS